MLKWAVLLIGILAASIVLPMVGGMFLPREHRVTSHAVIDQPVDSIWAVVSDLDEYPSWWSDVKSMEREETGNGSVRWIQRDAQGQELPIEVVVENPHRLLETRIADQQLPFRGIWTYRLEPVGCGTRVSITEEGEVFNPVFRVLAHFFIGYHGTIDRYLAALGSRFGQAVVPVHMN